VYKYLKKSTNTYVALKKLDMNLDEILRKERKILNIYQREVLFLVRNNHPLIINYVDSFRDQDKKFYLVTEFADKGDLK
jgi:serine/threonine protein kinase